MFWNFSEVSIDTGIYRRTLYFKGRLHLRLRGALSCDLKQIFHAMEQRTLKNVNNCLNTNIYSYSETSGVQSSNL